MQYSKLILVILFFIGCKEPEIKKTSNIILDGEVIRMDCYYPKKDDTLTFREETFYHSGKKNYIGNWVNGLKQGVWTWWYENGNKKDQCKFSKGQEIDTIFHWFQNGNLRQMEIIPLIKQSEDNSCSLCCDITILKYFENGNLHESYSKSDNKYVGRYEYYDSNGSWKFMNFENGLAYGITHEHIVNPDGKVTIIDGQYQRGKEDGLWKWFNDDSVLVKTKVYIDGKLNGEIRYYDEKGRNTKIEYFEDGKLESTQNK